MLEIKEKYKTVITAQNRLGLVSTSISHLELDSYFHCSRQILSSSIRLDVQHLWTPGLSTDVLLGLSLGFWLGHSKTVKEATPVLS